MYCAKCGGLVHDSLNFCNSCGAKLVKGEPPAKQGNPVAFLIAGLSVIDIAALFFFALLMLIFLDRHVDEKIIGLIATLFLVVLGGINFRLLRLISKLVHNHIENKTSLNEAAPANLF